MFRKFSIKWAYPHFSSCNNLGMKIFEKFFFSWFLFFSLIFSILEQCIAVTGIRVCKSKKNHVYVPKMVLICHSWVKVRVIFCAKKRVKKTQMSHFNREIKGKKAKKVDFALFLHSYEQKWDEIAWWCYNVLNLLCINNLAPFQVPRGCQKTAQNGY